MSKTYIFSYEKPVIWSERISIMINNSAINCYRYSKVNGQSFVQDFIEEIEYNFLQTLLHEQICFYYRCWWGLQERDLGCPDQLRQNSVGRWPQMMRVQEGWWSWRSYCRNGFLRCILTVCFSCCSKQTLWFIGVNIYFKRLIKQKIIF